MSDTQKALVYIVRFTRIATWRTILFLSSVLYITYKMLPMLLKNLRDSAVWSFKYGRFAYAGGNN